MMKDLQEKITSMRDEIGINSLIFSVLNEDRKIENERCMDPYFLKPITDLKRYLSKNGRDFIIDKSFIYEPSDLAHLNIGNVDFEVEEVTTLDDLLVKMKVPSGLLDSIVELCLQNRILKKLDGRLQIVDRDMFTHVQKMVSSFPLYGSLIDYMDRAKGLDVQHDFKGYNQYITNASSRLAYPAVKQVYDMYSQLDGDIRILDVGCGIGEYIIHLNSLNSGAEYVGIEIDPEVSQIASDRIARLPNPNMQIVNDNFLDWLEKNKEERFDAVFMNHIYHIVGSRLSEEFTQGIYNVTNSKGLFFNLEIVSDFPNTNVAIPILFDSLMRFYFSENRGKVFQRGEVEEIMKQKGYNLKSPLVIDFDTPNMVYFVGEK